MHLHSFTCLITYLYYLPKGSVSQTMQCQMAGQHANNESEIMSKSCGPAGG